MKDVITQISRKKEEPIAMDKETVELKENLTKLKAKVASKEAKKKENDESYATLRNKDISSKTKAQNIQENNEKAKKKKQPNKSSPNGILHGT